MKAKTILGAVALFGVTMGWFPTMAKDDKGAPLSVVADCYIRLSDAHMRKLLKGKFAMRDTAVVILENVVCDVISNGLDCEKLTSEDLPFVDVTVFEPSKHIPATTIKFSAIGVCIPVR